MPCPHCGATARQSRADGRCVSCGKQLPKELQADGADAVGAVARRLAPSDSPPIRQAYQWEVKCADFPVRQNALPMAAARAVASLPCERFAGLQLFLINNAADEVNDGWFRFSGHRGQEAIVFVELVATRIRHWLRQPTFRVSLAGYLPPGSLNDVIGLIKDGAGLEEWEKQRDGREAMLVFAAEVGQPVTSHAPGSRLVIRRASPKDLLGDQIRKAIRPTDANDNSGSISIPDL